MHLPVNYIPFQFACSFFQLKVTYFPFQLAVDCFPFQREVKDFSFQPDKSTSVPFSARHPSKLQTAVTVRTQSATSAAIIHVVRSQPRLVRTTLTQPEHEQAQDRGVSGEEHS